MREMGHYEWMDRPRENFGLGIEKLCSMIELMLAFIPSSHPSPRTTTSLKYCDSDAHFLQSFRAESASNTCTDHCDVHFSAAAVAG
jgi:hypothetical protein